MKEHLFFYAEWKEGELVTIEFSTVRENQLGSQQKKVKSLKGLLLAKNKKDIKQTLALAGAIYK
jgi:hypothetical protein